MVNWELWRTIGLSIDIISAGPLLAVGLFAALKRPRTRTGVAAGAFAIGMAIAPLGPNLNVLFGNERNLTTFDYVAQTIGLVGFLLLFAGLAFLASRGGRRLDAPRWILVAAAIASAIAAVGLGVGTDEIQGETAWNVLDATSTLFAASLTPLLLFVAVTIDGNQHGRLTSYALIPFALGWLLLRIVEFDRDGGGSIWFIAAPVLVASLWALAKERDWRRFAWTSWWSVCLFSFGAITANHDPGDLGIMGATRILAVCMIAYAVVRHRAFDIDVKLRFTLRQSTIAGIFVAVFVAVQAGVGEAVTARAGILAGAAATALLVFALGPIQRLAERLASTAMPDAIPLEERADADRLQLYEALAREAWSDGGINAKEARVLDVARERLGLSLEQAHAVDQSIRA